ncbi:transmembrane protein 59-like [Phyllopteryx taeniolatus]|uniref:transmembrane protein 59-like n=1 Tax=Phyllopteryx taeniolatus TaxID=161469 RepID=UPI002AD52542|nr:transmembrane protein 59-like [Phyllopteryx taeniolatus]
MTSRASSSIFLLLFLLEPLPPPAPVTLSPPQSTRPSAPATNMRSCSGLLAVLLAALAAAASSPEAFDNQLGDIGYCKKQCQLAVKNKGPAKESVMNACHRGCRLYSICQFVNGNAGFNTSKDECQGACQEAYVKLVEQEACSTGCASQPSEPEIKRRKLKAMTLRPKVPSIMEAVSSWCNDIVSSAQSFISSTWTFYLQADDGKVVVFQSQPELEFSLPELQAPRSNMADSPWPQVHSHTQKPHGVRGRGEKAGAKAGSRGKHQVQRTDDSAASAEHDFLGCMSRRSGLPRWILAACLFLSIMVMLWLSCASLVTAPEQHIKAQLSINGDNAFLDDNQVKGNPYHLSPLLAVSVKLPAAEDSQEAGPLPVKVDLDKTRV